MKKTKKNGLSLYQEIDNAISDAIKDAETNGHYKQGVLGSNRSAVQYALRNTLGHIRAIKQGRELDLVDKKKYNYKNRKK